MNALFHCKSLFLAIIPAKSRFANFLSFCCPPDAVIIANQPTQRGFNAAAADGSKSVLSKPLGCAAINGSVPPFIKRFSRTTELAPFLPADALAADAFGQPAKAACLIRNFSVCRGAFDYDVLVFRLARTEITLRLQLESVCRAKKQQHCKKYHH
jgi:hypothetical protein